MPRLTGGESVRHAVESGLAHRVVRRKSEYKTAYPTAKPEGYNTERETSRTRTALRRRGMYRSGVHSVAAVTKAHRSRVAVGAAHKRKVRKEEAARAAEKAKAKKAKARKKKSA